MKEQETDDLERMFREGLRDLRAEPDASVWLAIQEAMKKRKRFWLFWSITSMVAIGLVATLLLQSDTKLLSEEKGSEVLGSGSEVRGSGDEAETEGQNSGHPEQANEFTGKEGAPRRVEGQANEFTGQEGAPRRVEGQANEITGQEGAPRRVEGQDVTGHGSAPLTMTEVPKPETFGRRNDSEGGPEPQERHPEANVSPEPELTPRRVEGPSTLVSFRIPFNLTSPSFNYLTSLQTYRVPNAGAKTKPEADSSGKGSSWSVGFDPGLLFPSIQSFGKSGAVNYEKTNEPGKGTGFGLHLNYSFKHRWILRTGIDWNAYTVSGKHRYFGYTDTVEWIDRGRNTGIMVRETDRSWDFESRYRWIGIPVELGIRQNFGYGISWEWTLGAGLNYLYRYDKLTGENKILSSIDAGIKRVQPNLTAGFGVSYQLRGPWSTFINVRYSYAPLNLYESEILREKHQILRFGIGLQYQFKWKGN